MLIDIGTPRASPWPSWQFYSRVQLMTFAARGYGALVSHLTLRSSLPEPQLGNTSLILAAFHGNADVVELLLSLGVDIDAKDHVSTQAWGA